MLIPEWDPTFWNPSAREREISGLQVYDRLAAAIDRFAGRIATAEGADEMAWIARSLLELEIWADYCNVSRENTEQFWQDSVRDIFELLRGLEMPIGDPSIEKDLELSKNLLTGTKKHDNPTYVSRAAKDIHREEYRKAESAPLSKFAHPTALSLVFLSDPAAEKRTREGLAVAAKEYETRARSKLSSGYLADVKAKFGAAADSVKKELEDRARASG